MADHRITSNATSNTTITAAAATEPPELSEEAIVQCVTSKGPFTMNLIRGKKKETCSSGIMKYL